MSRAPNKYTDEAYLSESSSSSGSGGNLQEIRSKRQSEASTKVDMRFIPPKTSATPKSPFFKKTFFQETGSVRDFDSTRGLNELFERSPPKPKEKSKKQKSEP